MRRCSGSARLRRPRRAHRRDRSRVPNERDRRGKRPSGRADSRTPGQRVRLAPASRAPRRGGLPGRSLRPHRVRILRSPPQRRRPPPRSQRERAPRPAVHAEGRVTRVGRLVLWRGRRASRGGGSAQASSRRVTAGLTRARAAGEPERRPGADRHRADPALGDRVGVSGAPRDAADGPACVLGRSAGLVAGSHALHVGASRRRPHVGHGDKVSRRDRASSGSSDCSRVRASRERGPDGAACGRGRPPAPSSQVRAHRGCRPAVTCSRTRIRTWCGRSSRS